MLGACSAHFPQGTSITTLQTSQGVQDTNITYLQRLTTLHTAEKAATYNNQMDFNTQLGVINTTIAGLSASSGSGPLPYYANDSAACHDEPPERQQRRSNHSAADDSRDAGNEHRRSTNDSRDTGHQHYNSTDQSRGARYEHRISPDTDDAAHG